MPLRAWLRLSRGWLMVIAVPLLAALALAPVFCATPSCSEEDGTIEAPVKAKTEGTELRVSARERVRINRMVRVLPSRAHRGIRDLDTRKAAAPLTGRPSVPVPLLC